MEPRKKAAPDGVAPKSGPEPPFPQTPNPPLSDCLSGTPSPSIGGPDFRQTRQPAPLFTLSQCEYVDNSLCVNDRPGHVGTKPHVSHLVAYLSYRGVRNVRDLVRRYGVPSVQSVAQEVEDWEAGGNDWKDGLTSPGAMLHSMIRQRAAEVSGYEHPI